MLRDMQTIAAASARRDALQTEMAIKLAVGHTMHRLGEKVLEINTEDLLAFAKDYRVDVVESDDGTTMTYRVVKRD